jgi:hypothetical protein
MTSRSFLLIAAIFLSLPLGAEGLASYLPAKALPRALKLLVSIDAASTAIDSRRASTRSSQLKAEGEAVEDYALIAASKSSPDSWAKPDGSARLVEATQDFAAARVNARAAAQALVDDENVAPYPAREAAADALGEIIRASGIGEKSALGLEKYIAGKAKGLGSLFPEAIEIEGLLRKAGKAGAREAAAAMGHREAQAIVLALLAAKERIVELAPAAASVMARLSDASGAHEAWIDSFAIAAYPGELGSASPESRSALAEGIEAFSSLGPERAAALLSAMAEGEPRDAAAAEAARRLAITWTSSPAARRRSLATICGLGESTLSAFALAAAPRTAVAAPEAIDPLAAMAALNGLEIAIADEEASSSSSGLEPALLLLERPELASVARREARYANLFAEASRRLDALHAQAAEGADARLESSQTVFKSASRALGSSPTGMIVRSIDLVPPSGEAGRRIAFFVTATDAEGLSIDLPISAEISGAEYAAAFARAAGMSPTKREPASLLASFGQYTACAYDPEGSKGSYAIGVFPKDGARARSASRMGPRILAAIDLELALLGGWLP